MSTFATLAEVMQISGASYTAEEQERANTILPLVCDALRTAAKKAGKDLDVMAAADESYANLLKLVTCDIVARAMRQSVTGDPMSQESQSALGYVWSGTYAIPGGGIAGAIIHNDLKRLGLKSQRMGVIDLCPNSRE